MSDYSLFSLLACVGAIGAVRLFHETQRAAASQVAVCLLLFWVVEELAYPPFDWANPVRLFWAFGSKIRSEEFWPLYDGVIGALAWLASLSFWNGDRRAWWGPALWLLCLWSIAIHGAYQTAGVWNFDQYNDRLQLPFWARLCVFYAIGLKGLANHVGIWTRAVARSGLRSRAIRQAPASTREARAPR